MKSQEFIEKLALYQYKHLFQDRPTFPSTLDELKKLKPLEENLRREDEPFDSLLPRFTELEYKTFINILTPIFELEETWSNSNLDIEVNESRIKEYVALLDEAYKTCFTKDEPKILGDTIRDSLIDKLKPIHKWIEKKKGKTKELDVDETAKDITPSQQDYAKELIFLDELQEQLVIELENKLKSGTQPSSATTTSNPLQTLKSTTHARTNNKPGSAGESSIIEINNKLAAIGKRRLTLETAIIKKQDPTLFVFDKETAIVEELYNNYLNIQKKIIDPSKAEEKAKEILKSTSHSSTPTVNINITKTTVTDTTTAKSKDRQKDVVNHASSSKTSPVIIPPGPEINEEYVKQALLIHDIYSDNANDLIKKHLTMKDGVIPMYLYFQRLTEHKLHNYSKISFESTKIKDYIIPHIAYALYLIAEIEMINPPGDTEVNKKKNKLIEVVKRMILSGYGKLDIFNDKTITNDAFKDVMTNLVPALGETISAQNAAQQKKRDHERNLTELSDRKVIPLLAPITESIGIVINEINSKLTKLKNDGNLFFDKKWDKPIYSKDNSSATNYYQEYAPIREMFKLIEDERKTLDDKSTELMAKYFSEIRNEAATEGTVLKQSEDLIKGLKKVKNELDEILIGEFKNLNSLIKNAPVNTAAIHEHEVAAAIRYDHEKKMKEQNIINRKVKREEELVIQREIKEFLANESIEASSQKQQQQDELKNIMDELYNSPSYMAATDEAVKKLNPAVSSTHPNTGSSAYPSLKSDESIGTPDRHPNEDVALGLELEFVNDFIKAQTNAIILLNEKISGNTAEILLYRGAKEKCESTLKEATAYLTDLKKHIKNNAAPIPQYTESFRHYLLGGQPTDPSTRVSIFYYHRGLAKVLRPSPLFPFAMDFNNAISAAEHNANTDRRTQYDAKNSIKHLPAHYIFPGTYRENTLRSVDEYIRVIDKIRGPISSRPTVSEPTSSTAPADMKGYILKDKDTIAKIRANLIKAKLFVGRIEPDPVIHAINTFSSQNDTGHEFIPKTIEGYNPSESVEVVRHNNARTLALAYYLHEVLDHENEQQDAERLKLEVLFEELSFLKPEKNDVLSLASKHAQFINTNIVPLLQKHHDFLLQSTQPKIQTPPLYDEDEVTLPMMRAYCTLRLSLDNFDDPVGTIASYNDDDLREHFDRYLVADYSSDMLSVLPLTPTLDGLNFARDNYLITPLHTDINQAIRAIRSLIDFSNNGQPSGLRNKDMLNIYNCVSSFMQAKNKLDNLSEHISNKTQFEAYKKEEEVFARSARNVVSVIAPLYPKILKPNKKILSSDEIIPLLQNQMDDLEDYLHSMKGARAVRVYHLELMYSSDQQTLLINDPILLEIDTRIDRGSRILKDLKDLQADPVDYRDQISDLIHGPYADAETHADHIKVAIIEGCEYISKLRTELDVIPDEYKTQGINQNIEFITQTLHSMEIHYRRYLNKNNAEAEARNGYAYIRKLKEYMNPAYLAKLQKDAEINPQASAILGKATSGKSEPKKSAPTSTSSRFTLPNIPTFTLPSFKRPTFKVDIHTPEWMKNMGEKMKDIHLPNVDLGQSKYNWLWGEGKSHYKPKVYKVQINEEEPVEELDTSTSSHFINTIVPAITYNAGKQSIHNQYDVIAEVDTDKKSIGKIITFDIPQNDDEYREQAKAMIVAAIQHGKKIPLYITGPNIDLCNAMMKVCIASKIAFSTGKASVDTHPLEVDGFTADGKQDEDGYMIYTPGKIIEKYQTNKNFVGSTGGEYSVDSKAPSAEVLLKNIEKTVNAAQGNTKHRLIINNSQ